MALTHSGTPCHTLGMTETSPRSFHIGDLISVTTGRLVSPRHIEGVYDVCDFVAGQPHMTHQLPRACDEIKPWLLEQFPWLTDIEVPQFDMPSEVSRDDSMRIVGEWLTGPAAQYGEFHSVQPMPFGAYVGRDPIAELHEMMGPQAKIIGVVAPDSD
jgi:hypothetical protein